MSASKKIILGWAVAAGLACAFVAHSDEVVTSSASGAADSSMSKTSAASGRGATQRWVLMKIAESETNTMAKVDAKLNTLVAQLDSTVEANMSLFKDESNTNAVQQATQNCLMSAKPISEPLAVNPKNSAPENAG